MINEIKKELYKSKADAIFSHYAAGNLYYNVDVLGGTYQFPIPTVEFVTTPVGIDEDDNVVIQPHTIMILATDLGTTPYTTTMYAAHLNRWIQKAVEKEEFIKIK